MAERFQNKVVVITGASSGIGAAAARLFAKEGAAVVLAARSREPLDRLVSEISGDGGRAVAVPTDVGDGEACRALLDAAEESFGGIDVLVNNAGMNRRGELEKHSAEDLARIVQINLTAPIVLTRLVLPRMRKRGGGAIVNVASIAGQVPVVHEATYSATKFGLRAFSFALAEELREAKVTVSAVSPGPVETGFILEDIDNVPDVVFSQPMSSAEDIAGLVVECASDGAVERTMPRITGALATVGYLFPPLLRLAAPIMNARGKQAKEEFRRKRSAAS